MPLRVTDQTHWCQSYLRFNVPAWNGLLIGASLNLMPTTAQVPGVHGVAVVSDNTWTETGITWSNKPVSSASVLSTWTPVSNSLVSANVFSAITNSGQVSFRLYATTQTTDGFVNYGSRENGTPPQSSPTCAQYRSRTADRCHHQPSRW